MSSYVLKTSFYVDRLDNAEPVTDPNRGDSFLPNSVEWESWNDTAEKDGALTAVWLFGHGPADCMSFDDPADAPAWVPRPPAGWNDSVIRSAGVQQ